MNLKFWAFLTLLSGIIFLAGCNTQPATILPVAAAEKGEADVTAVQSPTVDTKSYEMLIDEQGAVGVAVTPLNLNAAEPSLEFEIAMDTHSVDLSMDLVELATLTTDNGRSVSPTAWDAEVGGHHVSGTLSFPTIQDDIPILSDAASITLTLRDIDAPSRIFTWTLQQ